MKILLPKHYKNWMTVQELENARDIIRDFKEIDRESFKDDTQTAARLASRTNETFEILSLSAEIAGNARANDFFAGRLDIYVEARAFSSWAGFYELGFYLSDLWRFNGENGDEIRKHMYIRAYTRAGDNG